ncbi:MAG: permease, partial [Gemmatimonadales bacterium]
FFIAGGIATFVSQGAVLRYLGPRAPKPAAYGVASASGSLLAVCSCTVLPLFAGIYRTGAGLGPATAFLYSGPAINALAIILTARVLGWELGVARAVGAVSFAVLVGLTMHLIFRREEKQRTDGFTSVPDDGQPMLAKNVVFFGSLVGVLVFANWGRPQVEGGLWFLIWQAHWWLTAGFGALLGLALFAWFGMDRWQLAALAGATALATVASPANPTVAFVVAVLGLSFIAATDDGPMGEWFAASWGFAKQILPLLLLGILVAGLLLGRPGHEGLVPSSWVAEAVGGNSLGANLFASVAGAFMYFATLTEVPILEGLLGSGMGSGPALALLLAGPALSLPSILVIRSVIGWKKTLAYLGLVIAAATIAGLVFGTLE